MNAKEHERRRGGVRAGLLGVLVLACAVGGWLWYRSTVLPIPGQGHPLVGTWETGGKQTVLNADGTGRNYDKSEFRWRTRGNKFYSKRTGPDGASDDWFVVPFGISRDGNEYRIALEGGRRKIAYERVGPEGKKIEGRTLESRAFDDAEFEGALIVAPPGVPASTEDVKKPDTPKARPRVSSARPAPARPPLDRRIHVAVGENVWVSAGRPNVSHSEVVAAADPPRVYLASMFSTRSTVETDAPKSVVYASDDDGAAWHVVLEHGEGKTSCYFDPTLATIPGGGVAFADMYFPSLSQFEQGRVDVVYSRDGGKTWGQKTSISGYHDRPFLAIDVTPRWSRGRLYCNTTTGLYVADSPGADFGPPVTWPRRAGYVPYSAGPPAVLRDGSVVVPYLGLPGPAAAPESPGYLAVRRSVDGGATFDGERVIAEFDHGRIHSSNVPSLAADPVREKNVYAVWLDADDQGRSYVAYANSVDRGATWSKPAALSESEPGGTGQGYDAFVPTLGVSADGTVGAAWYDNRGRGDAPGWRYTFRASRDGGSAWSPGVPVSTARVGSFGEWVGAGHTGGLAGAAWATFHAVWVDGRTGRQHVWTALLRVETRPS